MKKTTLALLLSTIAFTSISYATTYNLDFTGATIPHKLHQKTVYHDCSGAVGDSVPAVTFTKATGSSEKYLYNCTKKTPGPKSKEDTWTNCTTLGIAGTNDYTVNYK